MLVENALRNAVNAHSSNFDDLCQSEPAFTMLGHEIAIFDCNDRTAATPSHLWPVCNHRKSISQDRAVLE
jgi:hypothetical protein